MKISATVKGRSTGALSPLPMTVAAVSVPGGHGVSLCRLISVNVQPYPDSRFPKNE